MKKEKTNQPTPESEAALRQELVEHFREKRELLRGERFADRLSGGPDR